MLWARHEIDDVAGTIRASLEEVTQVATSSMPRREAAELESALRQIADEMSCGLEHLDQEVTSAINTEASELAALLRTNDGTDPTVAPDVLPLHFSTDPTTEVAGGPPTDWVPMTDLSDASHDEPERRPDSTSRIPTNNWERARQAFLDHASEVDDAVDIFIGAVPKADPPQKPLGSEVDDPVTATVLTLTALAEVAARWYEKRKG